MELKKYYNSISRQSGIVHKDKAMRQLDLDLWEMNWLVAALAHSFPLFLSIPALQNELDEEIKRNDELEGPREQSSNSTSIENWLVEFAAVPAEDNLWMKWSLLCWFLFFGGLWAAAGRTAPQREENNQTKQTEWNGALHSTNHSSIQSHLNQTLASQPQPRLMDELIEWMNVEWPALLCLILWWVMGRAPPNGSAKRSKRKEREQAATIFLLLFQQTILPSFLCWLPHSWRRAIN